MARVNVYVPDDLAAAARQAGLNVSGLTQDAIRAALAEQRVGAWLDGLAGLPPVDPGEEAIGAALTAARDEFDRGA